MIFKDNPKLKNIFIIGFLFSLHVALTTYINSSLLSSFIDEKFLGIVFAVASIASIGALMLAPVVIRKMGGYKFLLLISILDAMTLFLLFCLTTTWSVIPLFIFYFTLNILIIFSLDELIEIFSKNSSTGRIRGLYLAIINMAWIISQLFSSQILKELPIREVYVVGSVIMLVLFFVALFGLKKIPDPDYDKVKDFKYFREFFKNKNLARSYKINFLLQFFYVWMVVYTPIYLYAHLGFTWEDIGIIFAIMLVPFFVIPFHIGKYSDKIGERKMLILGFLIASCATLCIFFIKIHEMWIWAFLLCTTRIGAATIETMSDVYFFKHIKPENEEYIGIYRNAGPVAYIIGPIVAVILFAFLPSFNFIYAVLGAIMLYGVYLSSTIQNSDS